MKDNSSLNILISDIAQAIKQQLKKLLAWLLGILDNTNKQKEDNNYIDDRLNALELQVSCIIALLTDIEEERKTNISTTKNLHQEIVKLKDSIEDIKIKSKEPTPTLYVDERSPTLSSEIKQKTDIDQPLSTAEITADENTFYYCEASSQGDTLISIDKNPNIDSTIQLNIATGEFTIIPKTDVIQYVLANRDFCLGACNIIERKSANPTDIKVIKEGFAVEYKPGREWKVINKMDIILY